jgi:hypothetical protein
MCGRWRVGYGEHTNGENYKLEVGHKSLPCWYRTTLEMSSSADDDRINELTSPAFASECGCGYECGGLSCRVLRGGERGMGNAAGRRPLA